MKTRSISFLLILALFVTIGGVYAAWSYAEKPLTAVHGHIGSFGVANAVVNNSKGTITVNGDNAHLTFDQTAADNYDAKLVGSGSIVLIFAPSEVWANSNAEIDEIEMQYNLKTTNGDPLSFTVEEGGSLELFSKFDTATKKKVVLTKVTDDTNENYGKFVAEIPAASLIDTLISIKTFKLETFEKHEAFSERLATFGNIGIELSEIPTNPAAD